MLQIAGLQDPEFPRAARPGAAVGRAFDPLQKR
jgi:hypothetical protein